MTSVYLLRHGETPWNTDGNRYCGRTDVPLSATGRSQAEALRDAMANFPLAAVYVSPLARSWETGVVVGGGVPLFTDPRLIEIDFGGWEGVGAADIATLDPKGRAAWLHDPETTRAGGTGETGAEVATRMGEFFAEIATSHHVDAIAVVGHSTANRLFLVAALGAPLASYRRLVLHNGSMSLLEFEERGVRVLWLNNVAHLNGEFTRR